ncbi:MAG: tetratricopeptide repeat protein [Bacteroidales bacterium]|jgi:tetratricopeptide (TPR) repeat protein|nr:tetratricopeptide repeat protein [Bacteroidales bacterium]
MKKLLVFSLFATLFIGVSYSQEIKDSSQYDSGMDQIIVPTQILTSPTDGDTINTLVTAEGQEANIAYNSGVLLCNEGSFSEAIGEFSRAIGINPELAQAYYGRGTCYVQQKKYTEAIADLTQYTSRKRDSYATYLIGYCYFHKSDMENATKAFQNAIEQGCANADLFYHLGVINFNDAKYDKAIEYYTKAIDIDNKHAFSYNDRGSSYRMQGKYDKAITDYRRAAELNTKMDIFKANLGSAYRLNKDYENAVATYDMVLQENPKNYITLNNKGIALYEMKDYDNAIEMFNECLTQNKDYAYAYNNLGLCYYRKKEYNLAIEAFTKAIVLNPKYGEAYVNRGAAKEMIRDAAGACNDWNAAKALGIDVNTSESFCD